MIHRLMQCCLARLWRHYEFQHDVAEGKPVKLAWGIPLPKRA
jgi:hypothetical protein